MKGRAESPGSLLLNPVEPHSGENHDPQGNLLRVGIDVREVQAVTQDTDEHRAGKRSGQTAATAVQTRAANNHSGDYIQLVLETRVRSAGAQPRRQGHPRQTRQQAVQ